MFEISLLLALYTSIKCQQGFILSSDQASVKAWMFLSSHTKSVMKQQTEATYSVIAGLINDIIQSNKL